MSVPQARQLDDKFYCPEQGCTKGCNTPNSLRKHCKDVHKTRLQCKRKAFDLEKRKQQNREAGKRYRDRKSCKVTIQDVTSKRKAYTYKDVEQIGGHLQRDALVEVRTSQIPGGGNGVFACVDLKENDLVTWYAGSKVTEPPQDGSYAIKLRRGYLDGAHQLKQGVGLGSFINRQQRDLGFRKNCEFVECGRKKHTLAHAAAVRSSSTPAPLPSALSSNYRSLIGMSSSSDDIDEHSGTSSVSAEHADSNPCSRHLQTQDANFFSSRQYGPKLNVTDAVFEYNELHHRAYRVAESNKRRYKAVCVVEECEFVVQFAFLRQFKPPYVFRPHTCSVLRLEGSTRAANRSLRAKQVARKPEVCELFVAHGRYVSPNVIQYVMLKFGGQTTYKNCLNAKKRLLNKFFGHESEQYRSLPWYVDQLKERQHSCDIDIRDGVFTRLVIVFREGVQAFEPYACRGVAVDGTFLKTSGGGMLLVACFKNGNNEIQIVAVGVMSIENEDNWSWFTRFVLRHLTHQSAFIISDRDKGLLPALKSICPSIPHFYCFRHVLENFNKKFKSKLLKNLAWRLARSTTKQAFNSSVNAIDFVDKSASQWLLGVGKEKWSTLFSIAPRFGVLTSNHVESVNGALKKIRSLLIIDCLMAVERYIGTKFCNNSTQWQHWGGLTQSCAKRIDSTFNRYITTMTATANSENTFVVAYRGVPGDVPVEFSVMLSPPSCSCSFPVDMRAPCQHILYAMHQKNQMSELATFFDNSWSTAAFAQAYPALSPDGVLPSKKT